jgi:hypothetical protein
VVQTSIFLRTRQRSVGELIRHHRSDLGQYVPSTSTSGRETLELVLPCGCRLVGLGLIERTDGDAISVRITERKLLRPSVGFHMRFFFQPADERAPEAKRRQSCRPGRTRGGHCQAWRGGDLSTRDARGHPTRGGRVRPFRPSRRFARSNHGQEPSLVGQAAYHLKLLGTSATPMIVHVRFMGSCTRWKMRLLLNPARNP